MIEVNHLSYKYEENSEFALDDINLKIKKGEWVAIIGHNGSGKSTLAKALDGLIKAQRGTIMVNGITLSEETVWEVRSNIGMVFQNPDNQFVGADVEGDIAFGMENKGIKRDEMKKKVSEVLKIVNMQDFAKHEPFRLSGGQKQRVAIAGVLALQPKIIIFDESTSMLDPEGRRDIIKLMKDVNQDDNLTLISITHDIDEASLADRIIVLDDGKILENGTPRQVFSKGKELINLGLDVPYQERLKAELVKLGNDVPKEYMTKEEMVEWLCQSISKN